MNARRTLRKALRAGAISHLGHNAFVLVDLNGETVPEAARLLKVDVIDIRKGQVEALKVLRQDG